MTLRMVILATLLSIVLAIAVGVYAALRQGKLGDHIATVTNFLFLAAPTFVIGLLLKEFVAIPINQHLNRTIFYTNGDQSPTLTGSFLQRAARLRGPHSPTRHHPHPRDLLLVGHLPAGVDPRDDGQRPCATGPGEGYLPRRVLFRHVLRNALIPVTTVIALDFAAVLGGRIITEIVFGWQGLGVWFLNGVTTLDINVIAGLPAHHRHLRDPVQPAGRHPLRLPRSEDPL